MQKYNTSKADGNKPPYPQTMEKSSIESSPNGWMKKGKVTDIPENDTEAMEVGMVTGLGAD